MQYRDELITDFAIPAFTNMFKKYFAEMDVCIKDWDGLFSEMNSEGRNFAYIRFDDSGNAVGFIQFTVIKLTSWFFESEMGFIREFWVDSKLRGRGHGTVLLSLAEEYFVKNGVYKAILTTDTAENFYIRRGYQRDIDITAKNHDDVFVKSLR